MKREIKDKWVAALRSGEYQQTKEFLATSLAGIALKHPTLIAPVKRLLWQHLIRQRLKGGSNADAVLLQKYVLPICKEAVQDSLCCW